MNTNSIGRGITKETVPIEKCPDKHAVAEVSIQIDVLNEVDSSSGDKLSFPRRLSPRHSDNDNRITFGNGTGRMLKGSLM